MTASLDHLVRNRGIINDNDQRLLANAVVAIAGCGGDGGELAEKLARMGVRNFRLADPEVFSPENLNRQAGCYISTLGRNKAEVIAERIMDINRDANIEVYTQGVTSRNVFNFVYNATLVVDEMEYTEHQLGVMLAREARAAGILNIMAMNVAWGCLVTSFHPEGMPLEEFLGLDPDAPIEEIASTPVNLMRWLAGRLPPYADPEVLAQVAAGEIPAPSVAVGVSLAAGYASFEVANYLCRWREPLAAPRVFWADAHELSSGILTVNNVAVS
jgi:hypothetical protein